jgi:phospholipid transport system substrate-binding protein
MKAFACLLFGMLMTVCQPAAAEDSPSAQALLKENLAAVFAVLGEQDLDREHKEMKVVDIVSPMFDFDLMARLTLGKKHWSGLTDEQKEKFTQLFIKRLRSTYLDRLTLYEDEKVIYEAPIESKRKVHIPTYLVSKDKKISILYLFYESDGLWRIYDLEIQGVSIIRSYRAQFDEILQKDSFENLLIKMEKPVAN